MQKQVLRVRSICRGDLWNRKRTPQEKARNTFNLTYCSVFKNVRKILKELHLLPTPDKAHDKVFSEVHIIGFKNAKKLSKSCFRVVDREGGSKLCNGANCSCGVCESVKDTTAFNKAESEETFDIIKGLLDCNSSNVIYLFE